MATWRSLPDLRGLLGGLAGSVAGMIGLVGLAAPLAAYGHDLAAAGVLSGCTAVASVVAVRFGEAREDDDGPPTWSILLPLVIGLIVPASAVVGVLAGAGAREGAAALDARAAAGWGVQAMLAWLGVGIGLSLAALGGARRRPIAAVGLPLQVALVLPVPLGFVVGHNASLAAAFAAVPGVAWSALWQVAILAPPWLVAAWVGASLLRAVPEGERTPRMLVAAPAVFAGGCVLMVALHVVAAVPWTQIAALAALGAVAGGGAHATAAGPVRVRWAETGAALTATLCTTYLSILAIGAVPALAALVVSMVLDPSLSGAADPRHVAGGALVDQAPLWLLAVACVAAVGAAGPPLAWALDRMRVAAGVGGGAGA